jgi:hypothetical protein
MALTDLHMPIINNKDKSPGQRVVIGMDDLQMRQFFDVNYRYVVSSKGRRVRVRHYIPYSSRVIEKVIFEVVRAADEIRGGRTKNSLATWKQLERLREYEAVLGKRVDNMFKLPAALEALTEGQAGRLHQDMEAALVREGMWDSELKCEIPKPGGHKTSGRGKC